MSIASVAPHGGPTIPPIAIRNSDVDWTRWPVDDYVRENYGWLHPADAAVIDHHTACYSRLAPDSLSRSLELGAGPNLYPLMLAAAASRRIEAVEPSAANVAYLRRQLAEGPDTHWLPFYARCRAGNPTLPNDPHQALSRVRVLRGSATALPPGRYDLASMNFVAESVTEDLAEFGELCHAFVRAVRPGAQIIAAFMENMRRYAVGTHSNWPGVPVDQDVVRAVFAPWTAGLAISRIDVDPTLPNYGSTGMLLLTARRAR